MAEVGSSLVQDGEAVGVDVTPVVNRAFFQPPGLGQRLPAIAGAEDHDSARRARKGQEIGFVLGNEHALIRQD